MPYHPKRICEHPGCFKAFKGRGSYCDEHKPLHNKDFRYNMYSRDMDKKAFYASAKWLKIRHLQLMRKPICERCEARGKIVKADMVHHKDENCYNNVETNLMSLCNSCHSIIHKNPIKEADGQETIFPGMIEDRIDDEQFYSSTLIDRID